LRDSGIARRAIDFVSERARGNLPGKRMFATAGAEQEDVHRGSVTSLEMVALV
jgi:hypothetical protein